MPDALGSLVRHAARAACLAVLLSSSSAAQSLYSPPPDPTPPTAPAFMSRYAFHLSAAQLFADDIAFRWDTHFGGDWDIFDYVRGRVTFLADYQAVLGNEIRLFDPNQGNYVLEGAGSYRFRGNEIYVVFHHESRHLGDRAKSEAIAWNELDARFLRQFRREGATLDVRAEAGKVTEVAFVDYSWTANGDLVYRHPISPQVAAFGRLFGTLVGIDASKSDRPTQKGGKIEGGVRLSGEGGGFELFAGYEQVIDADAFAMVPRHWAVLGVPDGDEAAARPGEDSFPRRAREYNPHMPPPRFFRVTLAAIVAVSVVAWGLLLTAAVRPPKLQYELLTLPNGMTVVLSEDHSTPIVHLQMWYHVGSKNEKAGRTGFAHLFEHLMFKGSKNVEPESHISIVSGVGGQSNAYTTDDETVFWETVPSQFLPTVLWLEADRMASLRIDRDTFVAEREVVKEERRMRVDNQPYGRLSEIIYDQAFTVHPYKHATIGSMADLESASVNEVRDFYATYYVPSNATAVLVGDFDPVQAKQLIAKYLGRVPQSPRPVPRDIPKEPAQTRERRVTLDAPWPLPAVAIAYHITYDGHPDSYPLHIASKVLSDGQSSRIYQELVYKRQLAVAAFGSANLIEDPNLFYAVAIVQPGHTPQEVIEALIAELDRLKTEPISERELQRTKNQFARDYILGRESNEQKALQLGHAVVLHKDIKTADGEFEIFQNLTVADVQRVARTYFTPENRLVLTLMPSGRADSGPGGR